MAMLLKYNCPKCGREIITRYLMPGDTLNCPDCNSEIVVPQDAASTDQEPNIYSKKEHPTPWPPHILDAGGVLRENIPIPLELETSPEPTPWNIYSILKFAVALVVSIALLSCILGLVIGLVMAAFYPGGGASKEAFKADFSNVLAYIVTFLATILPAGLIYYSVVKRHHYKFFEALRLVRMPRKELTSYLLVGAGCVGVVVAIFGILELAGIDKYMPKDMPILEEFRHGYLRLIIFTVFALLAPAFEEILYRGYIFQGLRESFGVRVSAIIVTGLFVLLHAPQLGYGIIPLLFICLISIVLIWVRIKTDSLTKCIVIHQIYNTILVLIIWLSVLLLGLDKMAA